MGPLAFMARLAALVPRPRANLIRYHGVFAPNFKHRKLIVPKHSPSRHRDPDKPTAPLTLRGPPGCSGSNGSSRSISSYALTVAARCASNRRHRRSQGHSDHPRSHRTAQRGFRRTATRAATNFRPQRCPPPLLITPSSRRLRSPSAPALHPPRINHQTPARSDISPETARSYRSTVALTQPPI